METASLNFDYRRLGWLLSDAIYAGGRGYRAACAEIGIPPSAVSRLKAGQPVAAHTVLTACRWLGTDISEFVSQECFTGHAVKQGVDVLTRERASGGKHA